MAVHVRVDLVWEDIKYSVDSLSGKLSILEGLSGYAKGGELLAVMGPSGSGKTTFLDIITGRKNGDTGVSGRVKLNGNEQSMKRSSRCFSYVQQSDVLLNTATVRETLEIAAQLRVCGLRGKALASRVDAVLVDLGLMNVQHALVGGGEIRGLSGGERRRVSIGQEIVSSENPVLCLDEPTTGLDSKTAESVMATLSAMAKNKGMLIIATIHQPNSNITSKFDGFLFLAEGRCLFLGPFSNAVQRFAKAGLQCPLYSNPTDFFMNVASIGDNVKVLSANHDLWLQGEMEVTSSDAFRANTFSRLAKDEDDAAAVRCITKVRLLTQRAARQWFRDPGMLSSKIVQVVLLAIFIGGMYYDMPLSYDGGVFDRTASLFFILSLLIFTPPFTAITSFATERDLLRKERKDGAYGAGVWLLSKTICVVPMESLLCLCFSAISYWMMGLQANTEKFLNFVGILSIFQLIAESTGLLFAIATPSPTFAIVWLSLVLIVTLSLTGFLAFSMPLYYKWIMDVNIMRFALLSLIINEFEGLEFTTSINTAIDGMAAVPISLQPSMSLKSYVFILIGFMVALRLLVLAVLCVDIRLTNALNFLFLKYSNCAAIAAGYLTSSVKQRNESLETALETVL